MVCKFAIYSKSKTVSTACGQIAYSISPQTPSLPGRQPAEPGVREAEIGGLHALSGIVSV